MPKEAFKLPENHTNANQDQTLQIISHFLPVLPLLPSYELQFRRGYNLVALLNYLEAMKATRLRSQT